MRGLIDMPGKCAKTKGRKKCITKFCRNDAARRPNGRSKGALCHKCRSRRWRENSPMRAAYIRLKSHAKERGIEFRISFRHFKCFAEKSELIESMGQTPESLTIDRRKNTKGYIVGNIQVMTRAANSRKSVMQDERRNREGMSWQQEY